MSNPFGRLSASRQKRNGRRSSASALQLRQSAASIGILGLPDTVDDDDHYDYHDDYDDEEDASETDDYAVTDRSRRRGRSVLGNGGSTSSRRRRRKDDDERIVPLSSFHDDSVNGDDDRDYFYDNGAGGAAGVGSSKHKRPDRQGRQLSRSSNHSSNRGSNKHSQDDDSSSSSLSRISFNADDNQSNYSDDDLDEDEEFVGIFDELDANSLGSDSHYGNNNNNNNNKRTALARQETTAIYYLRSFLWLLFFVATVAVSVLAYRIPRQRQIDLFRQNFSETSRFLTSSLQNTVRHRFSTVEAFRSAVDRQSHIVPPSYRQQHTSVWPNFTVPDLQRRSKSLVESTKIFTLLLVPLVPNEPVSLAQWEAYANQNQHWLQRQLQSQTPSVDEADSLAVNPIVPFIYETDTLSPVPSATAIAIPHDHNQDRQYLLPVWQFAPVHNRPSLVNENILVHDTFRQGLQQNFFDTHTRQNDLDRNRTHTSIRPTFVTSPNVRNRQPTLQSFQRVHRQITNLTYDIAAEPITDLYTPIFSTSDPDNVDTTDQPQLAAILLFSFYWKSFFQPLASTTTEGILIVVSDSCADDDTDKDNGNDRNTLQFTYELRHDSVQYLGIGDRHDSQYDTLVNTTTDRVHVFYPDNNLDGIQAACQHSILIYPSDTYASIYCTDEPMYYGIILASAFIVTSCFFFAYTKMIEQRQRVVMEKAVLSSTIVSSLFPETVRDRLVGATTKSAANESPVILDSMTSRTGPSKQSQNVTGDSKTHPIADTFENTTVLFADIAGFTSWCAKHEPSEVFLLLETLYGEFDKIAKRRDVFKVETIGDCYVACTGLPEPQEDHAIIMSLFAHECMRTMKLLLARDLRSLVGGDSLSMRFGLHSGGVTAGVLRGEKSRFQLFGDTVNTAAKIEHTGKRDRIHLSQTTGELLIKAGKRRWLVERSESVVGMQTYWLRPRAKSLDGTGNRSRGTISSSSSIASSDMFSVSSRVSLHSRAWPEASTHSKAWNDTDNGSGFNVSDENFSESGDSFA